MGKQMKTKIHIPFVVAPLFLAFVRWGPWGGDGGMQKKTETAMQTNMVKSERGETYISIERYIYIYIYTSRTTSKQRYRNTGRTIITTKTIFKITSYNRAKSM